MEEDRVFSIAQNVVNTTYDTLPKGIAEFTKKLIIDTVGVSLCGSTEKGVKELIEIFRNWGGKEESTIWVYGGKVPCINAAQVNATMIHAPDYDDTHDASPIHVGVVTVPAALAIAEMRGPISGKEIITAIALGADFAIRLCLACKIPMVQAGWHYTALHGNFAAAAVAGKLMGLDQKTLISAIGLSNHQAAGTNQGVFDGVLAKRVGPGFAVRNGMMAALMAQKGITGARRSLEGVAGLYNVYHRGEYDPKVLTEDLGKRNWVEDLSYKPYASCRNTHGSIEATLSLIHEHKIRSEEIESIKIICGKFVRTLSEPSDIKLNPRNTVDAQFSVPWGVAVAAARGKIDLESFSDRAIKDKELLAMASKVSVELNDSFSRKGLEPVSIEIKTKDGKVRSKHNPDPYGSPTNPMSMEVLFEKFRDCASHAVKPINKDTVENLLKSLARLEEVNDVSQTIKLLNC